MTRILPLPLQTLEPTQYYTKSEVDALIANFVTNTVDDLVYYYSKTEVDNIIQTINQFKYEVYPTLQDITTPATNILYLIGPDSSATGDLYEEYVYDGSDFIKIGDTSIDLSDYVTSTDLQTALADYTPTANLATVATSGAYSDLSGTPTLATVATSGAYSDLTGTPTLATVATSGAYSDLSGTPTLATVATSGSYADLTNTPTIPTVNDSTITITQGGVTKGSFTLNQGTDATIDVDAGGGSTRTEWFGTQDQFDEIPNNELDTNTDYYIAGQIDYNDLKNTPTIPNKTSQLQNDSSFMTQTQVESEVNNAVSFIKTLDQYVTRAEYNAMVTAGTIVDYVRYHIEDDVDKLQMVVTFTDSTTATYNVYIEPSI